MPILRTMYQSLKDGDQSIETLFGGGDAEAETDAAGDAAPDAGEGESKSGLGRIFGG